METTRPDIAAEAASERSVAAERSATYRSFWRKLDAALGPGAEHPDLIAALDAMLATLLREFRDELAIASGRLYEKVDENRYVLRRWYGDNPSGKLGFTVPITYPAVQMLLERGLLIMKESDPGFDRSIEDTLGVSVFAAMTVGEDGRFLLAFSLVGEVDREKTLYLLSAIQHVVGQRIRQQRFLGVLEEARLIQLSLLPRGSPQFQHYDVHGRTVSADAVGGDLYDFLPVGDRILGVAIADASGHGLPAALQARDVITGLRMGIAEHLKIVSTVERLNKVINRSTLATRFVSLFYGELEKNGNFIYTNAGHPPGLLLSQGRFKPLDQGGLVLGPDPEARYDRGYVRTRPGDLIVLYTDGITEATSDTGEEFGVARLQEIIAAHAHLTAKGLTDLIFRAVEEFSRRAAPRDDQTLVVVRNPVP
jgi:sigma-B regulation protein RsbU (phosphoserine phosphatase)